MGTQDEQAYRAQVAQLRAALEIGKPYLPIELLKQGYESLGSIERRLDLGVDHTIVALAGGTGSGKSSTFNAISGLEFADVGVRRPTTARLASCTWSSDATELLDWLEVDPDRRISRDTALDGADQAALHGMILLDLPDHDSVAEHHRAIVDKVLPLVDVLIWIVDPQKYADEALHAGYLRSLVGSEASMIVALNQIDTLPAGGLGTITSDISRLLTQDGLEAVEIRAISARTGEGVAEIREDLRKAVSRRTMASRRLRDELAKLARAIAHHTPQSVTTELEGTVQWEAERYLVAAGIPALADEISEHTALRTGRPVPSVAAPSLASLNGLRDRWIERVTLNMRKPFAREVSQRAGSSEELATRLAQVSSEVDVPWGAPEGVSRTWTWILVALSGVVGVLALLGLAGIVLTQAVGAGLLLVALVLAAGAWFADRQFASKLRSEGRERAHEFRQSVADAYAGVVSEVLIEPIRPILDDHRKISALTLGVLNASGGSDEPEGERDPVGTGRHATASPAEVDHPQVSLSAAEGKK